MKTIGKVKWFNDSKGFGFISSEGNDDAFAHYTRINVDGFKTLTENQCVSFDLVKTSKGPEAHNITISVQS